MSLQVLYIVFCLMMVSWTCISIFRKARKTNDLSIEDVIATLLLALTVGAIGPKALVGLSFWYLVLAVVLLTLVSWLVGKGLHKTYSEKNRILEITTDTAALIELFKTNQLQEAARELQSGISCVTGLTDGWAELLNSVKNCVDRQLEYRIPSAEISKLIFLRKRLEAIVYR